jgi:hypothetical protein
VRRWEGVASISNAIGYCITIVWRCRKCGVLQRSGGLAMGCRSNDHGVASVVLTTTDDVAIVIIATM